MKHFPFGPYNCCNATEIAEHKKKMKKKNRIKNIFTRYSCCHRKFTNSKMESVATNFNLHYIRFPSSQFSCYTFPPPQCKSIKMDEAVDPDQKLTASRAKSA